MASPRVYCMRAERGNAISNEKPSLLAGVAGAGGLSPAPCPSLPDDRASSRTATTCGAFQARRIVGSPFRDPFCRIVNSADPDFGGIMPRAGPSDNGAQVDVFLTA